MASDTSNLKKYFLYALGELSIIIIGILVALQLDAWNEQRKRRATEIEILNEIKTGFHYDLGDIKGNINYHNQSSESCRIILDHFEKDLPYHDSLSRHFSRLLGFSRFIENEGPYEVLKSKGLDIITNQNLRTEIVNMYDLYYESMLRYEENTFVDESYVADVIGTRFDKTELWRVGEDRQLLDGTMIPHDYEQLKKDKLYLHVVKSKLTKNDFLINYYMRDRVDRLEKLISSIEGEIEILK
jgi:hypothetical protein